MPALVGFRIALWSEPLALAGRLLVAYTREREHGPDALRRTRRAAGCAGTDR